MGLSTWKWSRDDSLTMVSKYADDQDTLMLIKVILNKGWRMEAPVCLKANVVLTMILKPAFHIVFMGLYGSLRVAGFAVSLSVFYNRWRSFRVAGIELVSTSVTQSLRVFMGRWRSLPIFQLCFHLVFHDLSRSFFSQVSSKSLH